MDYGSPLTGPPQPRVTHYPYDYDPALNGIGGWLVLLIIGRFAGIIIAIKNIVDASKLLGKVPDLDGLYYLMIIVMVIDIILSGLILYFMFARKIVFRLLFVIQMAFGLLVAFLMYMYLDSRGYNYTSSSLISSIAASLIWIAYLYKSKRVRNTYIYPYQDFEEGQGL